MSKFLVSRHSVSISCGVQQLRRRTTRNNEAISNKVNAYFSKHATNNWRGKGTIRTSDVADGMFKNCIFPGIVHIRFCFPARASDIGMINVCVRLK